MHVVYVCVSEEGRTRDSCHVAPTPPPSAETLSRARRRKSSLQASGFGFVGRDKVIVFWNWLSPELAVGECLFVWSFCRNVRVMISFHVIEFAVNNKMCRFYIIISTFSKIS